MRRGEIFVILGGSGCGKSTLLRTLVGLLRPNAGQILMNGQDIACMNDEQFMPFRRRMGMCFQGSALLNSLSVADNVALPLREHTKLEESTIDIMTKIKLELVGFNNHLRPGGVNREFSHRIVHRRAASLVRHTGGHIINPRLYCIFDYDNPYARSRGLSRIGLVVHHDLYFRDPF